MREIEGTAVLGVYFEEIPSPYDPPNAHQFYQALGKAIVAWGRLEGNFNHLFIAVLNVAPDPMVGTRFHIHRERLAEKWTLAFATTPELASSLDRATAIVSAMEELATHRDHYVHGLWGHFVSTSPLARRVEKVKPRAGTPDGLWHSSIDVSTISPLFCGKRTGWEAGRRDRVRTLYLSKLTKLSNCNLGRRPSEYHEWELSRGGAHHGNEQSILCIDPRRLASSARFVSFRHIVAGKG